MQCCDITVFEQHFLAQITYGATIASFLGGIHWGAAMLDPRRKAFYISLCLMQECLHLMETAAQPESMCSLTLW